MLTRRLILTSALITAGAFAAPASANEPILTVKNYIGKITVVTSPDAELSVTDKKRSKKVDFDQSRTGLVVDGGVSRPDGDDCKGYYGRISWSLFSKKEKTDEFGGYENLDDYPDLTITGPEDMTLVIENAIPFGTIGDIGSADIDMRHCGRLNIGNISGPASFKVRGSGDISAGNIGDLIAKISGSGDLDFINTRTADLTISGSGDVEFENAVSASISISGSGDVEFNDIATSLYVKSSGSGDIDGENVGEEFTYEGRGSGDVSLNNISGRALIQTTGSSTVDIDDGNLQSLIISATGSSDIFYDGVTEDADVTARGSSDVYIKKIKGMRSTNASGSSDIEIGN